MKTFATTASLLALLIAAPALAQNAQPGGQQQPADRPAAQDSQQPPAATQQPKEVQPSAQSGQTGMTPKSTKQAGAGGDWRASKLIGSSVRGSGGESIGDINDLILTSDGSVKHVIVGVGGFLGIGEKNVALAFEELNFERNENGNPVVRSQATKQSLESAAEWKGDGGSSMLSR